MKFEIKGSDLHYVMAVAGAACAKNETRPVLVAINCKIEEGHLKATGLDGYLMHQVTVPVEGIQKSDEAFNILPIKVPDKKAFYSIEVTDKEIIYRTARGTVVDLLVQGTYLNTESIYPTADPVFTIYVNPKLLAITAKAYSAEPIVKLEFYGVAAPIKLSGKSGDSAIVLPMRPKDGF